MKVKPFTAIYSIYFLKSEWKKFEKSDWRAELCGVIDFAGRLKYLGPLRSSPAISKYPDSLTQEFALENQSK